MEKTLPRVSIRRLVRDLRERLEILVLTGEKGLDRLIEHPTIERPGLALTGYLEMIEIGHIQIWGQNEVSYLESLSTDASTLAVEHLVKTMPPCIVVTADRTPPQILVDIAVKAEVPVLKSPKPTAVFIEEIHEYLYNLLADTRTVHGVLMDVIGVGVLITGKSGIGKSECALDLIQKGHRLVGDDVVEVYKRPPATVIGRGAELIRHHMEIRGLGIISIKDLYGISAVRNRKVIDIVVRLEEWQDQKEYDRLGLDRQTYEILNVPIPMVVLPVAPGRHMASIVEVAARNMLLHKQGHNPAVKLAKRVNEKLKRDESIPPAEMLDIEELRKETE